MRFHNFILRCKFLRAASKGIYTSLPEDVTKAIRQEWANCFIFRDESPWSNLCWSGAETIVRKFPWLRPHINHIKDLISNY